MCLCLACIVVIQCIKKDKKHCNNGSDTDNQGRYKERSVDEMKYEKGKDGSHLHNCYIERRDGDLSEQLFRNDGGVITAFLNGYAIIPIDRYACLVEMASPGDARLRPVVFSHEDIEAANKDLYGCSCVMQGCRTLNQLQKK